MDAAATVSGMASAPARPAPSTEATAPITAKAPTKPRNLRGIRPAIKSFAMPPFYGEELLITRQIAQHGGFPETLRLQREFSDPRA